MLISLQFLKNYYKQLAQCLLFVILIINADLFLFIKNYHQ